MNAFFSHGKRRAISDEIRNALQDATGATPAYGFAEMLESGDALVNSERTSGFAEMHDRREWLLRLSAKKGMTWQTDAIPDASVDSVIFVINKCPFHKLSSLNVLLMLYPECLGINN